jgi:homoserine dehydrogenase
MKTVRLLLCGLGNVGRSFLAIMQSQEALLHERYGLRLQIVGAVDSGGGAIDPGGIAPAAILAAKSAGRSVASLDAIGRPDLDGITLARTAEAEILLEATPVSMRDGMPGLEITRSALRRGINCVLANKGPLALAYAELAELSDLGPATAERGNPRDWPALRFSACVGGALPTINIGLRDLAGARITRVEAVLNGTTQGILRAMEAGESYADALAEMQRRGLAETDPSLDVEGWDSANKLVIIANAVLRRPTTLADLHVTGIGGLTAVELQAAAARGMRIVLLGLAAQEGDDYRLSVAPAELLADHPLARMGADEMGVVYYSDIAGRQAAMSRESDPAPTAAAMLRDLIEIAARHE